MFIYRLGENVPVYVRKKDGENRLNEPNTVYQREGNTLALKYNTRGENVRMDIGEFTNYEADFIVPYDSIAEEDCHVIYGGKEYALTVPEDEDSYVAFQSKRVEVLTISNPSITVLDEDGNELQTPI